MITLEEIYQGLAAEFRAQTGKTAGGSSELAVRFYAVAAQIYSLYVQGEWTRRQCFPQTAIGEDLDKHAKLRNITRRQAAKATGTVRFYVDQPQETGTEISKGTVCMTAAGVRFLTTQTVVVEAGKLYAEAPVIADEAGAAGNVGANAIVFMALPPVKIVACANPEPLTNGLDEEGDEELRARVLATYQRLANGANNAFYRQAAMSFDEVAAVMVLPKHKGVGTVGVVPAAQGGVPSDKLLEEMQAYFDRVREIACEVTVIPPEVERVDLELELWAREDRDFNTVAGAVERTLTGWFNGERLGQPLLRAQLTSLVFGVDGVANCVFVKPEADLPLNSMTLPVLNELKLVRGREADIKPKEDVGRQYETGNSGEAEGAEN